MDSIPFTKMHGLGNSHIYIDGWRHPLSENDLRRLAATASCPHTGIGSDGLIAMGPSSKADLQMRIFNKDGSEAKNCGNGLRCVAKYVYEHGRIASKTMTIETLGGIVKATLINLQGPRAIVSVNMGQPCLERQTIPMQGSPTERVVAEPFEIDGHSLLLTAVSMGNPHAVFFVPSIKDSLHRTLGPKIEKDSRFSEGVNIEFIAQESSTSFHLRVWERGAGATQACGTGACAAAVASVLNGLTQQGQEITMHLEGGDLQIQWANNGDVHMTGSATTIAIGSLFLQ